jgi:hypothetical protein
MQREDTSSDEPQDAPTAPDAAESAAEHDHARRRRFASRASRTSDLLRELGDTPGDPKLRFSELIGSFGERAFGVLLLIVLLPVFIPVPFGVGAIAGPLISLVALPMMFGAQRPWLPRWLKNRGMQRETLKRFVARHGKSLSRIERVCKPRWDFMLGRGARLFTGLLLVILGLSLALPIPFTNYPFGLIILFYVMALIEHDGLLMAIGWILGLAQIVALALLSGGAVNWAQTAWMGM